MQRLDQECLTLLSGAAANIVERVAILGHMLRGP
jgi:hypothetical protein